MVWWAGQNQCYSKRGSADLDAPVHQHTPFLLFLSHDSCPPYLFIDEPSPNDEPEFLYYMNDGVYGSFTSKLADNVIPAPALPKVSFGFRA